MTDNDLGIFLRAQREAVAPADVGLPVGGRRRTPGLRRSELATLAGVSVEYLARLEQGRDRRPSPQVLGAIADALGLSNTERGHLHIAAKSASGETGLCPAAVPPASEVRPTVRALLNRLDPTPAVVLNRLSDILAHTTGYQRLVGPIGLLDDPRPNLIRFVFTDDRARAALPEWEGTASELAAGLGPDLGDPHRSALVDELTVTAGAAFTDRMAICPPPLPAVLRLAHPEAGELRLAAEVLAVTDADYQRLIVYLPADEATATALDRLDGRQPRALRAVT